MRYAAQMDSNETFESLAKSLVDFARSQKSDDLNKPLRSFLTEEQQKRDKDITELFDEYKKYYKDKTRHNKGYRIAIFVVTMAILLAYAIIFFVMLPTVLSNDCANISEIAPLITASVTFIALVIGILKIITTYVFPKDDEKYISEIVKLIQSNDLEHKKEDFKRFDK